MQKNDEAIVKIEGTTSEGLGVARLEGRAIFIKGAAEGETCRIGITKISSSAVYARLMEIIEPSKERITPDCPWYGRCGGCAFRHISYREECRLKAARVTETLRRIGGIEVESLPFLAAENPEGYRNKAVYPVRQGKSGPEIGFFRERTHEIVPVNSCRIQNAAADALRAALLDWMKKWNVSAFDEAQHRGLVRTLFVRTAEVTGEVLACIAVCGDKLPREQELVQALRQAVPMLKTVVLSIHKRPGNAVLGDQFRTLWGPGTIEDELCGLRFRLSPKSFYQVNHAQAERLYKTALSFADLNGNETVLDLYCGTGTITLCLARQAGRAIGVEVVAEAIADAKENARRNGQENAEFFCMDAGEAAQKFAQDGIHPDVIVVDPPRKGVSMDVIEAIRTMAPQKVVYVSCDPATLARDLALLTARGYRVEKAAAADLFPRCAHIETVVLLSKGESTQRRFGLSSL